MFLTIKKFFRRFTNPVSVGALTKKIPVSRQFGFDRGMPIDRYYIEKFINENNVYVKGNILEIAEETYSKKFSLGNNVDKFNIMTFDKNDTRQNVIFGDLINKTTLQENTIDCFICTQTFNFIYEIKKAIEGAYYLLKPNGVLIATVSGLSQISRYDMERWGDYWRFTNLSIKKLFESVFSSENIKITVYGNFFAAISLLEGIAMEDIPNKSLLDELDEDYQITIGIIAKK